MYIYNKINEAQAMANWSEKLEKATGVKDPQRLRFMSLLAESKMMIDGPSGNASENALRESYGISTTGNILGMGPAYWGSDPGRGVGSLPGAFHHPDYQNGSGDVPSLIMGMALNVAAYCIGFDLLTTIAVDMPTAIFQFLDSVYAGGSFDGEAGEGPIYFQVSAKELNGKADLWANVAYGDYILFRPTAGAGGAAVRTRYIGRSFVTGDLIVKFEDTGNFADDTYTKDNAKNLADTFDAIGEAVLVAKLGADGVTADASYAGMTINDPKLDYVSAVREHIQGFSNNDGITKHPMTREQLEKGTKNKLNLKLWSKTTEIKGIEVEADITRVQLRDLKAYGVDGMAMLYKAVQNQLIQDINDDIIEHLFALGVKNAAQLYSAQGVNLNMYLAPAGSTGKALSNFGCKFVDPLGNDRSAEFGIISNDETNSAAENQGTRQRRLSGKILAASGLIATIGRYGEGDVCVVNGQIGTALKNCANFVVYPLENTIGKTGDLHFIGTIGNIKVYQNPKMLWNDTRILVAMKGTEETPGAKLLAYDLAQSVEIIAESTMAPKICVSSRYEIIDAGFYSEAQYLTFLVNTDFPSWV